MAMTQQSFLSLGPDGFHRIAYTDWGDARNAHVVLCVHGLSRNSRDFDPLAEELETHYRVVCMDVVGCGDSDWLADKSGYSFSTYLSDAASLIARVTTPLAARPGSPIRRLVLNDVGPFVPWDALIRLKGRVGSESRFASYDEVEDYVRRACESFGELDDAYWQHLARQAAVREDDGSYRLRYDPAISRGLPLHLDPEMPIGPQFMRGVDLWATWDALRCPVLVLRGAQSEVLTRGTVDEMIERKPNVKVVEFDRVGHAPALASRDQIEVVREFLNSPDAG